MNRRSKCSAAIPGPVSPTVIRTHPLFSRRHAHVRETIEIMQGIWSNELFEHRGEFADFPLCGFGHKPIQQPGPPIYFSGLKDSAKRIAKYGLQGWIGIQDSPEDIKRWRGAMERELKRLTEEIVPKVNAA